MLSLPLGPAWSGRCRGQASNMEWVRHKEYRVLKLLRHQGKGPYLQEQCTDGFLSRCSTLDPAYRGEQRQPYSSMPVLHFLPPVGGLRKLPCTTPPFKVWILVSTAREEDGGNKEEASCGAGTGMQVYSLTRWFLLVGVWSVGGQFSGAKLMLVNKDFNFYCFLSRKQQNSLKSLFCPTVWKGGTAIWWWVHADSCQSARSDQLLNPKWWCQSFKQEEEKLHLVKFGWILCFLTSFHSHYEALERWFCWDDFQLCLLTAQQKSQVQQKG